MYIYIRNANVQFSGCGKVGIFDLAKVKLLHQYAYKNAFLVPLRSRFSLTFLLLETMVLKLSKSFSLTS